jgi:hypothetical protein
MARLLCQSAIQLLLDGPTACGHTTEQWAFWMVRIASNYHRLGDHKEVKLYASKARYVLGAAGLTECYVYADYWKHLLTSS